MKLVLYHRVRAVAAAVFLSTALMVPPDAVQGFTVPRPSSSSKLVVLDIPASLFGDNGQINFYPPTESYTKDEKTILENSSSKQQPSSSSSYLEGVKTVQEPAFPKQTVTLVPDGSKPPPLEPVATVVQQEAFPKRTVNLVPDGTNGGNTQNNFFSPPPPPPRPQSQFFPSFDSQQQSQQIVSSPQVLPIAAVPPPPQVQSKAQQPQGQVAEEATQQQQQQQLQQEPTTPTNPIATATINKSKSSSADTEINYYTLLGVQPTDTQQEVQTKYLEWVKTTRRPIQTPIVYGVATPSRGAIFGGSLFQEQPPNLNSPDSSSSSSSVPSVSSSSSSSSDDDEEEQLRRVEEAWAILSNYRYRQRYDQELLETASSSSSSSSGEGEGEEVVSEQVVPEPSSPTPWNPLEAAAAKTTYTTDFAVVDNNDETTKEKKMPQVTQEESMATVDTSPSLSSSDEDEEEISLTVVDKEEVVEDEEPVVVASSVMKDTEEETAATTTTSSSSGPFYAAAPAVNGEAADTNTALSAEVAAAMKDYDEAMAATSATPSPVMAEVAAAILDTTEPSVAATTQDEEEEEITMVIPEDEEKKEEEVMATETVVAIEEEKEEEISLVVPEEKATITGPVAVEEEEISMVIQEKEEEKVTATEPVAVEEEGEEISTVVQEEEEEEATVTEPVAVEEEKISLVFQEEEEEVKVTEPVAVEEDIAMVLQEEEKMVKKEPLKFPVGDLNLMMNGEFDFSTQNDQVLQGLLDASMEVAQPLFEQPDTTITGYALPAKKDSMRVVDQLATQVVDLMQLAVREAAKAEQLRVLQESVLRATLLRMKDADTIKTSDHAVRKLDNFLDSESLENQRSELLGKGPGEIELSLDQADALYKSIMQERQRGELVLKSNMKYVVTHQPEKKDKIIRSYKVKVLEDVMWLEKAEELYRTLESERSQVTKDLRRAKAQLDEASRAQADEIRRYEQAQEKEIQQYEQAAFEMKETLKRDDKTARKLDEAFRQRLEGTERVKKSLHELEIEGFKKDNTLLEMERLHYFKKAESIQRKAESLKQKYHALEGEQK